MKKMSETVVFFGSGPVAARSLRLLAGDFKVEAVVTKPKPAHHKGSFPVIDVAGELKLPVLTVTDRSSLDKLIATRPTASHLAVLIDFGIIVSQAVIDYFELGIVNSHFSLLPKWRGADPITFAILSGEHQTGISLMLLNDKMDEGPLLAQAPYALSAGITAPELTDDLIDLSHKTLQAILPLWAAGRIQPASQDPSITPTYSRKLTKNDGVIDWRKPAAQLEREIRAFIEWPKSRTTLAGKDVIVTKAHALKGGNKLLATNHEIGTALAAGKELHVTTGHGILVIQSLKPAGRPEMSAEAFLAGYGGQIGRSSQAAGG